MGKLRVLLADDHDMLLERGRSILSKDFEVMGTVEIGREAVAEVRRLNPDVLVIDISLPVKDGLQAASQLHGGSCPTKIVFVTVHEDQDYVDAGLPQALPDMSRSHMLHRT